MPNNGDKTAVWTIGGVNVRGLGSFHKSLPHNDFGEVIDMGSPSPYQQFLDATFGTEEFYNVPHGLLRPGETQAGKFTNPRAGLASDCLIPNPCTLSIPEAPTVFSPSTAAEMAELYWMAMLRDVPFDKLPMDPGVSAAIADINAAMKRALAEDIEAGKLHPGIDLPGGDGSFSDFTTDSLFRLGLPGEGVGPLISQFFIRDIDYGAQMISQKIRPYRMSKNYLTNYFDWLAAQNTGNGKDFKDYPMSNEAKAEYYECESRVRYISTCRDLARFVNKDALHQAYFNAALILLSSNAKWTLGNPYRQLPYKQREAGFGTLGGPHILALVSEVATRALQAVWYQKWQEHLRLRPEAYGGLVHVSQIGAGHHGQRPYPIPQLLLDSAAFMNIRLFNRANDGEDSVLLPIAFTGGSPLLGILVIQLG